MDETHEKKEHEHADHKDTHEKKEHRHTQHRSHHKDDDTITLHTGQIAGYLQLLVLIVILIFAIVISGNVAEINEKLQAGNVGSGSGSNAAPQQAAPQPTAPTQPPQQAPVIDEDMEVVADDDAFKGDANAPVTIVEFSDFECPFCTRFYEQTLPQIESNYIDTGKVKFVYRDLPLSFHPNAQKAGEAAECAADQDMFWEMHDALFDKGVSGGVTAMKQYAADLGLNTADFNDCLDSGKYAQEVKDDASDAQRYGISGTPGFIINGEVVVGAQPYAAFEAAIERALGN